MTEKCTVLFEELPQDVGTQLLRKETMERLSNCRTGFGFKGYYTRKPGYICIPVSHGKKRTRVEEHHAELSELGYKKLTQQEAEKYHMNFAEKDIYAISIRDMLDIHKINIY